MTEIPFSSSSRAAKRLKTKHFSFDDSLTSTMSRTEENLYGSMMEKSTFTADVSSPEQSSRPADITLDNLGKEAVCGITEFVSPNSLGFTGISKKRYTDFLVNEILPSGVVVHLDTLEGLSSERQVNKTDAAGKSPFGSARDTMKPSSIPAQENLANKANDTLTLQSIPNLVVDESVDLSSSQQPKDEINLPRVQETMSSVDLEHQIPIQQNPSLELDCVSTRRTYKTSLRATDSGLVEVIEHQKSECPLTETKTTGNNQNDEVTMSRSKAAPSSPSQWQNFAKSSKSVQISNEDQSLLHSFFDTQTVNATLALYERVLNSPFQKAKNYGTVQSAAINDREMRTNIHQSIRRIFKSQLETVTGDDGSMVIFVATQKPSASARIQTNGHERERKPHQKCKPGWDELGGEYLHFTLYKENKDTMEVISYLAKQLRMKPQAFQFAGTKDRRGVTVQRVSVYRVSADRMKNVGTTLRNAKIGSFEYRPHQLTLGDLTGNEFIITLRDCNFGEIVQADINPDGAISKASNVVKIAVENLKDKGFINYYGLQRFGTFSTGTDTVGVKILQGDFKAAVQAILYFDPASLAASQNPASRNLRISDDDKARAYALHLFQTTGKMYPALDKLPRKFSAEASIVRHLGKPAQSNDYQGALQTISRNLRLMYVHAYQSLVWNIVASERWKRFGDKTLEGDLVLVNEHKDKAETPEKLDETDADGEIIVRPADEDRAGTADDIFTRARALTKDEAASGQYSIFDIVLPTPGFDILYPSNEIGAVYVDFMASDRGGGLDPHNMRRKWKDFSLSGSYRKLLARPAPDISYDVKAYTNEHEQFVQTDLDRLLLREGANPQQGRFGGSNPTSPNAADESQSPPGQHQDREAAKLAVVLRLKLGSSQYATMALRELMKEGGLQVYRPDFGAGR